MKLIKKVLRLTAVMMLFASMSIFMTGCDASAIMDGIGKLFGVVSAVAPAAKAVTDVVSGVATTTAALATTTAKTTTPTTTTAKTTTTTTAAKTAENSAQKALASSGAAAKTEQKADDGLLGTPGIAVSNVKPDENNQGKAITLEPVKDPITLTPGDKNIVVPEDGGGTKVTNTSIEL